MIRNGDGLKASSQTRKTCGESNGDRKGTVATGGRGFGQETAAMAVRARQGTTGEPGTTGARKVRPRQTARAAAQVCRCPGWVKIMCGTWLS